MPECHSWKSVKKAVEQILWSITGEESVWGSQNQPDWSEQMCQMDPVTSEIITITHTHALMLANNIDLLDSSENLK